MDENQYTTNAGFEAFKSLWENFVAGLYPNSSLEDVVVQAQQDVPKFSKDYTDGYTVGHAAGYASCLRREGRDALEVASVPAATERTAYICKNCEAVYADEPVSSCDCMSEAGGFYEGSIRYAGKQFHELSEKDKECVDNGLLPPDDAPQARHVSSAPASPADPYHWTNTTPSPDIDYKSPLAYSWTAGRLPQGRAAAPKPQQASNGWPDYIQWHPSAPESPPRWARITVFGFEGNGGRIVFNDNNTSIKSGDIAAEHESDLAEFMSGLHLAHQSTKRPRIYIAGPMSGLPELNFPAFHAEAARLRALGYEVVNPAEINAEHPGDWASCMKADLKQMMDCNGIYLLPGWTESRGATLEHSLAQTLGMVIHYKPITQEVL